MAEQLNWLERTVHTREVGGSSPSSATKKNMDKMEEYPSPAEGIGLENRQGVKASRGFESLFLRHIKFKYNIAGWSSW